MSGFLEGLPWSRASAWFAISSRAHRAHQRAHRRNRSEQGPAVAADRGGSSRSPNWEIACFWDRGFPNLAVMTLVMETAIMVEVVTAEYESRAHSEARSPVRRPPSPWIGPIWVWIGVGAVGTVSVTTIRTPRIR